MPRFEDLPYRPCVGMCVLNRDGRVFIGRRIDGPEHVDAVHAWQMPQGGVDRGEDPWPAARRELYEETTIRSVEKLGEIDEWLCYGRRPCAGIRRMALGADEEASRAGRAVQAAGLRAGGEGIREVREISKAVGWTFSAFTRVCDALWARMPWRCHAQVRCVARRAHAYRFHRGRH